MTSTRPENRCPSCLAAQAQPGADGACTACGWRPGDDNAPPALPLGTELHGCYRIGRVLGKGGFGITYLAWEQNLAQPVAIKEYLPTEWAERGDDRRRVVPRGEDSRALFDWGLKSFLKEARAVSRFRDEPAVVTVYNFFRANATAYMVMEYIKGVTLKTHLEGQGGTLAYRDALRLLDPVMDALAACHQAEPALLHRDIAPDNIYLTHDGRTKLIDFGAARQVVRDNTQLTSVFKRRYAPIEQQAVDGGKQGPWTDVYALAATLYQALTGSPPPDVKARVRKTPVELPSRLGCDIPPGAERALMQALALWPKQRTKDIARLRHGLYADLPRVADPSRAPGRSRRNAGRWVLGILGTFLLGLLINTSYDIGSRRLDAYWARVEAEREAQDQRAFAAAEAADDIAAYRDLRQCHPELCKYRKPAEERIARLEAEAAARPPPRMPRERPATTRRSRPQRIKTASRPTAPTSPTAALTAAPTDPRPMRWGQPKITPNQGTEKGRFVKLDPQGRDLPDAATAWSCVRDTVTGLTWEVKTDDGGLRDQDHSYSWYDPNPETNGGNPGAKGGGECAEGVRCDTAGYVEAVNAARLCGADDWRLPSREALRSIVDYGRYNPAIDTKYFPNTPSKWFWSASAAASDSAGAWGLGFGGGRRRLGRARVGLAGSPGARGTVTFVF
jgi:serine/threonine protein kinase